MNQHTSPTTDGAAWGGAGAGGGEGPGVSLYVGVDVHKDSHQVAIIPAEQMKGNAWRRLPTLKVTSCRADFDRLLHRLNGIAPHQVAIAIDHTGGHYSAPLVHFLAEHGYHPVYLQARALKDIKTRFLDKEDKTDDLDARSMARVLWYRDFSGDPLRLSLIHPRLGSLQGTLRALVTQRWSLVKTHTQATNRLHTLGRSIFPEAEESLFETWTDLARFCPLPADIAQVGAQVGEWLPRRKLDALVKLAQVTVGIPAQQFQETIKRLANLRYAVATELDQVDQALAGVLAGHPYTPILRSFPGLQDVGVATLISVVGDIDRWPTHDAFRKLLGVYVVTAQSGKKAGQPVMGREGSKEARRVLWQAVFSCISPRFPANPYREYYQRVVQGKKARKPSIVATMGKYAEHLYHCLKNGEPYSYQEATRFTRKEGNGPPPD